MEGAKERVKKEEKKGGRRERERGMQGGNEPAHEFTEVRSAIKCRLHFKVKNQESQQYSQKEPVVLKPGHAQSPRRLRLQLKNSQRAGNSPFSACLYSGPHRTGWWLPVLVKAFNSGNWLQMAVFSGNPSQTTQKFIYQLCSALRWSAKLTIVTRDCESKTIRIWYRGWTDRSLTSI